MAASNDSNVGRRFRAAATMGDEPPAAPSRSGGNTIGSKADDHVEQAGMAVCRHQKTRGAHRVAEADQTAVGCDRFGDRQCVVAVAVPVDLPVRRPWRWRRGRDSRDANEVKCSLSRWASGR